MLKDLLKLKTLHRIKFPLRMMKEEDTIDSKNLDSNLSPGSHVESKGTKRPSEENNDEAWVKRIVLNPKPCENGATQRRKLRKFALLLSYCGQGYLGMQRNPGFKTIEDDLLMAMLQASLIKEEGVTCPQIYRFQRAARTDKGVSAARQIVSIKLPDDVDIPEVINEHLSEQIRVMKAVRVTQKFDAKTQCDSRSYSYLTPTFAFAPTSDVTNEEYRISEDVLKEIRSILSIYKGTHNFHNFTSRVKYNEQRANRYIMDFNCSDPFIRNGLEWTMIKVKGQSFMLHQIRKMVGLAMAICKGYVSKDIYKTIWGHQRRDIPIAPGLGLVLEEPHYDYYNQKYYKDGVHEQLVWDSEKDRIQAFREKYIDSVIIDTEVKEKTMLKWLETLELHTFSRREDGLPAEVQSNEQGTTTLASDEHSSIEKEEEEEESKVRLTNLVTTGSQEQKADTTSSDNCRAEDNDSLKPPQMLDKTLPQASTREGPLS